MEIVEELKELVAIVAARLQKEQEAHEEQWRVIARERIEFTTERFLKPIVNGTKVTIHRKEYTSTTTDKGVTFPAAGSSEQRGSGAPLQTSDLFDSKADQLFK